MSFTGLSTQYVIRTGWGQHLAVFAQNDGTDALVRKGDAVVVAWRPEHAFPLRDESAAAGQPSPALATSAP